MKAKTQIIADTPDTLQISLSEEFILRALVSGEANGWAILQILWRLSGEVLYTARGSIYHALKRLETHGFVTSRLHYPTTRQKRRLYMLTAQGRHAISILDQLRETITMWRSHAKETL